MIDFSEIKIAVLGDAIIDIYLNCDSNRLAPEGPFPVLKVNNTTKQLGGSLNVALNCINLGAQVTPLIINSNDEDNQLLKEKFFSKNNFHNDLVFNDLNKVSYKYRTVAYQKIVSRHDIEETSSIPKNLEKKIFKKLTSLDFDLIILSDYNKGVLTDSLIVKIINFYNNKSIPILVDPKQRDNLNIYKNATFLTPNLPEAKMLIGFNRYEKMEIFDILIKLKQIYNLRYPLITLGEEGIAIINDENKLKTFKSENAEVFDVTGAGDTVISTLGVLFAKKLNIEECIKISNHAASKTVKHLGTYAIKKIDIEKYFHKNQLSLAFKMNEDIELFIKKAKELKKTIVFTNGCFDILHYGHVKYLKKAKEMGDILIVGLNTDESITKIKGEKRPINNLQSRFELLSSIKYVDLVITFNEDTPIKLIKKINPDLLVKGGDYSVNQIIGKEFAKDTKILPLEGNYSTTSIINKIKNLN